MRVFPNSDQQLALVVKPNACLSRCSFKPSGSFSPPKSEDRQLSDTMAVAGCLRVVFGPNIQSVRDNRVEIPSKDRAELIDDEAMIVLRGGILHSAFLRTIGIPVETKLGTE